MQVAFDEAVNRLVDAIQAAGIDDLVEIHNEIFPTQPVSIDETVDGGAHLAKRVLDHIRRDIEVEEILGLWHVVFPEHRKVCFDDESRTVQYDESGRSPGSSRR